MGFEPSEFLLEWCLFSSQVSELGSFDLHGTCKHPIAGYGEAVHAVLANL